MTLVQVPFGTTFWIGGQLIIPAVFFKQQGAKAIPRPFRTQLRSARVRGGMNDLLGGVKGQSNVHNWAYAHLRNRGAQSS